VIHHRCVLARGRSALVAVVIAVTQCGYALSAQAPGLPANPLQPVTTATTAAGPRQDKRAGEVAASSGPITLKERVPDRAIRAFLAKFLPKYPGVRTIDVGVDDAVVTLEGRIDDDDSRNEITDVVKRVEGVRLVLNHMQTDEEVMTAWGIVSHQGAGVVTYFAQKWAVIILAGCVVAISFWAARAFAARSDWMLERLVRNVLLRSIVGSLISSLLVLAGLLMALGLLDLTRVVLSILGLAGVAGLAIGFAFRDITENFIASILLGLRRPFQIGDYITVAGQSGVVKSLNTRATVLVTFEGNHVRIPNSVIFKEIMINATASPVFRNSFDVVIPNETSTSDAMTAISRALTAQKHVLADPAPRALIEALEPDGVRLRVHFWSPTQGVDWFQLMSDAKLRVKVALQGLGIMGGVAHLAEPGANGAGVKSPLDGAPASPALTPQQARANFKRDSTAAAAAGGEQNPGSRQPIEQALEHPETRVSEEGTNLLQPEPAADGKQGT
jgi:small conductance mechanosensitive channel